jgi:Ca2+-binding EF-hand superfamily protein
MQQQTKRNIVILLAAIIANLGVSSAYAEKMQATAQQSASALFGKLDANGDGYVTVEEAAGKISPEVFANADADHDGKLSLVEFVAAKLDKS